jgi:hypothetical protein
VADRRKGRAAALKFPKFPADKPSAPALIRRLAAESAKGEKRRKSERWYRVHLADRRPFGVLWFGDPHLGTCTRWDRLERHVALCVSTPGLYGANLGDTSNNWAGKLIRKYADEDVSKSNERELIRWFLAEAGITWLVWLLGNHDAWDHGSELIRGMDVHNRVPMHDWEARFRICTPGGEFKIHAAHDFPGSSMHNPTHGNSRAVRWLQSDADLYICGHRHTFGLQQFETPETGRCPVMARAAGYKAGDEYARRKGFPEAGEGQSVLTIFDGSAGPAGRVLAFADIEQGARVLRALRGGK